MDNDNPRLSIEKLWEETLAEIQLQLTRSTFDTWMKGTHALYIEKGVLHIGTPSPYAVEWLENRLERMILEALARHGHPGKVKFIVNSKSVPPAIDKPLEGVAKDAEIARPPLSKALLEIMEFDPTTRGWVQTPAYAIQFWQPYLSLGPFNLWQTIRSFGQGEVWPSITTLADILCGGNNQMLTGRTVRGKYYRGWLEVLEAEKILWYTRKGQHYLFRILDRLPLLAPQQVETLSKARQKKHREFLTKAHVDLTEWQQLTLASLSKGVKGG